MLAIPLFSIGVRTHNSHVMSETEKQRLDELKRIPRGSRGSAQNQFRSAMWSYRGHSESFEERVSLALSVIRKFEPSFTPDITAL
jgi:hypothetical protein